VPGGGGVHSMVPDATCSGDLGNCINPVSTLLFGGCGEAELEVERVMGFGVVVMYISGAEFQFIQYKRLS
jgi:hypothetical protein